MAVKNKEVRPKLNKVRLRKLARLIEASPDTEGVLEKFRKDRKKVVGYEQYTFGRPVYDHQNFIRECGSVMCMAGRAVHEWAPGTLTKKNGTLRNGVYSIHVAEKAQKLLGLTVGEAQDLFAGKDSPTSKHAAEALRHLADKEKVPAWWIRME